MDERNDEHEEFERLLRQGLRPLTAPAGFSARLMARLPAAAQEPSLGKKRAFWAPAMRWATAAVLLLVAAGGSYWRQFQNKQESERQAGERARGQLLLALRMSAATLNDVQHKVLRSTKGDAE